MSDCKRLSILKTLTSLIQSITPDQGYAYDLSESVFRGRSIYGNEDALPMISILESPVPETGTTAGWLKSTRKVEWELLIQGWVKDDRYNPLDPAYDLSAAVQLQLGKVLSFDSVKGKPNYPEWYMLGGLIQDFDFASPVHRPPTEGLSDKAFFFLPVKVCLVEDKSKIK